MQYWDYEELIECVKESYQEFYTKSVNKTDAIIRAANEYINMGIVEDIIIDVIIGEIMITEQILILEYVKGISQTLSDVNFVIINEVLSEKDQEDLKNRINKVKKSFSEIITND